MQRQRDFAGKVVLVTGATSGIGLETVRALARRDAHVIVGARDVARGRAVVDSLRGDAELLELDLASFASIRAAAKRIVETHASLDVLVNNAGIAPLKRTLSVDGHESVWATNVLGPFLLTQLLLPLLLAAPEPRVVNVTSTGYRIGRLVWDDLEFAHRRYAMLKAYAQSKLALVLFTRILAQRESRLAVNCLHPGSIATSIMRELPAPLRLLLGAILRPAESGAAPVVRLAVGKDAGHTSGLYFDRFKAVDLTPIAANEADAKRLWALLSEQTTAP